jgi:cysteine synthase
MKTPIDLTINDHQLDRNAKVARERNIRIPTFAQMRDPGIVPAEVTERLRHTGLWDVDPVNLYRITWKNEAQAFGGLFRPVPNYIEIPPELSGVKARIIALAGKFFPTGAHKVGATFACLVPRLVTGQFDPQYHEAVWPSTGNYCRGGAYIATLLGCKSIAILPEGMSKERFDWLKTVAGEVISTPGSESNVKEIFDKTWELRRTRDNVVVLDQFGELGNHLWHYAVTGPAMDEVFAAARRPGARLAGVCLTSGSAGTMGCADYLKELYPHAKLAVGEALQCPTLLSNGFGAHRIEGIGDKHVPWIHNVRNTDMVIAIDDNDALALFRLVSEPSGQEHLRAAGVSDELVSKLDWAGISGAANILSCIKFAKYYELGENDVVMTVLTDSAEMYRSRLGEMQAERGRRYAAQDAAIDHARSVLGLRTDSMEELTYQTRKRIHNLKYYTWIEQQMYDVDELQAQWYDHEEYWGGLHRLVPELDRAIERFNRLAWGQG